MCVCKKKLLAPNLRPLGTSTVIEYVQNQKKYADFIVGNDEFPHAGCVTIYVENHIHNKLIRVYSSKKVNKIEYKNLFFAYSHPKISWRLHLAFR